MVVLLNRLIVSHFIRHEDQTVDVWIGLKKNNENGEIWQWINDEIESNTSSIWDENEPNNDGRNEECAVLLEEKKKVNDIPCTESRLGLCELNKPRC